jgi:pimeloyl-ACP methyl ester carboxylesterase
MKMLVLLLASLLFQSQDVMARDSEVIKKQGVILSDVPQKVDTKARYLFYLSGYIVEAGNMRPTSPRFGVYEYEQILDTFKQSGFVVISEARKKDPEIEPYGARVAEQIRRLIKAGVPPEHITVVGASQGSWIAMLVSTYLKNRKVNFVLIAACSAEDSFLRLVDLHGNILFISERSDLPGSCKKFRADATGLSKYKEVEVNTGLAHGFIYRPMKEWVEPTLARARR